MLKAPAYVSISSVFLILIGIGLAYSYFFYPDSHPLSCVVKFYTGKECATCGFSRSFSYYTHLEFARGRVLNPLSWPVFLFFVGQAVIRFFIVMAYSKTRRPMNQHFIISDALVSILFFLLAFLPLLLKEENPRNNFG